MTPTPATLHIARPDGAELVVHAAGNGPAVLLISGLGGTAAFWRPVVDVLKPALTLVTIDQRGIGGSSRGSAPVSIETLAADCNAAIEALGIRRVVLVGHSTGGCIAMTMAAQRPEQVDGVVLSATWLTATPYMQALFAARRAMLDSDGQAYATIGAMLGYPSDWLEANWNVFEAALRTAPVKDDTRRIVGERISALLAFDGRDLVPRLTMPCMVFGARDDMIVPLSAQKAVHAAVPGSTLEVLQDGGHFFPVTRTEAFTGRLQAFAGASP